MEYKKSNLKVGDKVQLNDTYFSEGFGNFGKNLLRPKNQKHIFTVKEVYCCEGVIDGHGDESRGDVIEVDGGKYKSLDVICSVFLKSA